LFASPEHSTTLVSTSPPCDGPSPVHRSQTPNRTFLYRPADPPTSLGGAIADFQPDIVIPCDDRAAGHLPALPLLRYHLAELIQKSLGHGGASGALASRAALPDLGSLPNEVARARRCERGRTMTGCTGTASPRS
jgi:hypothetical protein